MKHAARPPAAAGDTAAPEPPSPSSSLALLIPSASTSRTPVAVNGQRLPRSRPLERRLLGCSHSLDRDSAAASGSGSPVPPPASAVPRGQGRLGGPSPLPDPSWSAQPAATSPSPPQAIRVPPETPPAQSRAPWQSQPPKWKLQTQIFCLIAANDVRAERKQLPHNSGRSATQPRGCVSPSPKTAREHREHGLGPRAAHC